MYAGERWKFVFSTQCGSKNSNLATVRQNESRQNAHEDRFPAAVGSTDGNDSVFLEAEAEIL